MPSVRPLAECDCWPLYEWANDAATRDNSFSTGQIERDEHLLWFRRQLCDPDRWGWMLELDGIPVAVARYDRRGDELEASVTVAPEQRGKGYGSRVLEMSTPLALRASGLRRVRALVFADNVPSVKAFERAGYGRIGRECWVMERMST